ncbi:hypothetical protein N9L01_00675 [bacterium]|nr:hypothetical protein [bacterium]
MDNTEITRALRAAEHAVDSHTRQRHFGAPETKIITEGLEETAEQATKTALTTQMKTALKAGWRATYDNVLDTTFVKTGAKYTGQAVVVAGVITGGIWLFTGMGGAALNMVGSTAEKAEDFAANHTFVAAGLGIGMLLGVTALGIVIYRRLAGGGDEE